MKAGTNTLSMAGKACCTLKIRSRLSRNSIAARSLSRTSVQLSAGSEAKTGFCNVTCVVIDEPFGIALDIGIRHVLSSAGSTEGSLATRFEDVLAAVLHRSINISWSEE